MDYVLTRPLITADLSFLENAEPVYKTFPGWPSEKTSTAKSYAELPEAARTYIQFIEDFIGVPVQYIGVGPSRENMLTKPATNSSPTATNGVA